LLAQNILSKLICKQEKRLDVYQTLNHDFFKEFLGEKKDDDIFDEQTSSVSNNIEEFNQYFLIFVIIWNI